jgi:DNA-binding transcriptional ArsR family regulator
MGAAPQVNALVKPHEPATPAAFELPSRPRVKPRAKQAEPPKKTVAVMPMRACIDPKLGGHALRVLALLCSYANRAGITWVGQQTLADQLKVSRQSVSRQMRILREAGYIEILHKGFKGVMANTVRVIFDPNVSAEDAVAITSTIEDTRPPHMKAREERQMEEPLTADPEGQRKVANLLANALTRQTHATQPTPTREYRMPKEDTIAVRQVKEAMAEAQARRRQSKTISKTADSALPVGSTSGATWSDQKEGKKGGDNVLPGGSTNKNLTSKEKYFALRVDKQEHTPTHPSTPTPTPAADRPPPGHEPLDGPTYRALLDAGVPEDFLAECTVHIRDAWRSEGIEPSARQVASSLMTMWERER